MPPEFREHMYQLFDAHIDPGLVWLERVGAHAWKGHACKGHDQGLQVSLF